MKRRVLLLGVVHALLGFCGCASSLPGASEERGAPSMPEGLAEPGRRIWEGDRETWQLMSSGFLSPITDVIVQPPKAGPNQILIVGPYGAFTTGQFPDEGHTVSFEDPGDGSVAWEVQATRLANALNTLGFVKTEMNRGEEARADLEAALRLVDRAEPDADRLARDIHYNLGSVFYADGEMAEAEFHYLESLDSGPPDIYPADRAKSAYNLARVYLRQGRREEAERMARIAVENDTVAYSADHEEVAKDLRLLSEILPYGAKTEDLITPPASSVHP